MTQATTKKSAGPANIWEAVLNVQQSMGMVAKSADNPFFKSKYADLPDIWAALSPLLGQNKLIVHTYLDARDVGQPDIFVAEIIFTPTGDKMTSTSTVMLDKITAQALGSYTTYMRRYSICMMFGIVTDDDDGNAASAPPKPKYAAPAPTAPAPKPVDTAELMKLQGLLKGTKTIAELKTNWATINAALPRMNPAQVASITALKDARKKEL
tara:strand:+ start:1081 stop:1713 length:633 start_codon:yes stop_codon:yes gene_type:complete